MVSMQDDVASRRAAGPGKPSGTNQGLTGKDEANANDTLVGCVRSKLSNEGGG